MLRSLCSLSLPLLAMTAACIEAPVEEQAESEELPPAPVVGSALVGNVDLEFRSALALYREDPADPRNRTIWLFASGASRIGCDDVSVGVDPNITNASEEVQIPPSAEGEPMARIKLETTNSVLLVDVFGAVACADGRCAPEPSSFLMGDFMTAEACPTTPSQEGLSATDGFGDSLQIFCQNVSDEKSVRMTATVCQPD